jgi:hypothetical protein
VTFLIRSYFRAGDYPPLGLGGKSFYEAAPTGWRKKAPNRGLSLRFRLRAAAILVCLVEVLGGFELYVDGRNGSAAAYGSQIVISNDRKAKISCPLCPSQILVFHSPVNVNSFPVIGYDIIDLGFEKKRV